MTRSKSSAFDFGRLTRFGVFNLSGIVALTVIGLLVHNQAEAGGIAIDTPRGSSRAIPSASPS